MLQNALLEERFHKTPRTINLPLDLLGCSIAAAGFPTEDMNELFYEFYHPIPEVLDFVLGKVKGAGTMTDFIGSSLRTHLLRLAIPFYSSKHFDKYHFWEDDLLTLEDIRNFLEKDFFSNSLPTNTDVSIYYGRFNFAHRTFACTGMGTTFVLYYNASSGIFHPFQKTEQELTFGKGDIFVISYEKDLSIKALKEVLLPTIHQKAEDILNKILSSFNHSFVVIKCDEINTDAVFKVKNTTFLSHLSQLSAVREFVSSTCQNIPGNAQLLIDSMQLVVTELFTNSVKHAYHDDSNGVITISGEVAENGLVIELSDRGDCYDPSVVPYPSFAGDLENGFGWYIVRSLADEISYRPKTTANGWNHLRIFKHFLPLEDVMELKHRLDGEVLVIVPSCESLDARLAKEFKQQVIDIINKESSSHIVLDLSKVQYVDSSGLGSLLSVLKFLHSKGGEMKLTSLSKPVSTIFELVAMHKIFKIYPNAEDAINSCR